MVLRNWLLLIVFVGSSCNSPLEIDERTLPPAHSKHIDLRLADSLGTTDFFIPDRYDTLLVWVNHSDCGKPCDQQEYRFQIKKNPIVEESGFFFLGEPHDTVDQFTISHSSYEYDRKEDTTEKRAQRLLLKERLRHDPSELPVAFDTVESLNGRYYALFEMERSGKVTAKKVLAITTLKGNTIRFQYDLLTSHDDTVGRGFFNEAVQMIRTIHIYGQNSAK
jgi:hypothetical protein